jgi:hypothetical protein
VVDYALRAKLDATEHRVKGEGTITWRNLSSEPQREIWLHLYLNAFKNERTVFMRSTASRGFRGGERPKTWGWVKVERFEGQGEDLWAGAEKHSPGDPEDETDLRVPLVEAIEPGGEVTFDVAWTAQLPSVVARTGFAESFHMVAQWFPKIAKLERDGDWAHFPFHRLSEFYADYGRYDVTIDVPEGFVVGASGQRTETRDEGGRHVVRHAAERVHDFAFCAWDGFEEHLADASTGVKMRALVPRGDGELAAMELAEADYGLGFLGEHFGAYPYDVLTIVHPPRTAREAGGMEYPTLITTGGPWFQPRLGMRTIEGVTVHELAHQWFYGLVGSNEHEWPFLDEGLTTWATLRALEERYPGTSGLDRGWLGLTVGHPGFVRMEAARVAGFDQVAQSARGFALGSDYGGLVYGRTATLLETLYQLHPEGMAAAMKRYATSQRWAHPEPKDLVVAIETEVGPEVARVMRQVLFERGTVDFAVASMWSEKREAPKGIFGDPLAASDQHAPSESEAPEGHVGAIVVRRTGSVVLPVEIAIHSEGGEVERRTWDGKGEATTLRYEGSTPLAAVVLDPDHRILLDDDLSNNVARRSRGSIAARVWAHGSFIAHGLLTLGAP